MPTSQKYQIQLAWLNSTGGWEYWNFLARKTYGYDIANKTTIKNDIFQNWDTDFIAGTSEVNAIKVEANEVYVVRSQLLTVQQMNAIARIKLSIRVWDVANEVVVLVDNASFQYRTDSNKLNEIEFTITYPSQQIQSL